MNVASLVGDPVVQCDRVGADLTRVGADDQRGKLVHGRLAGPAEAVESSLADAVQALVGDDPDEQPILPAGAYRVGLNVGDLHGTLSQERRSLTCNRSGGQTTCQVGEGYYRQPEFWLSMGHPCSRRDLPASPTVAVAPLPRRRRRCRHGPAEDWWA